MNGYLLDTNICIFALRDQMGVNERLEKIDQRSCFVSDITILELRYGAYKSSHPNENLAIVDRFIECVNVIPLSRCIDCFCLEKIRLQRQGLPIEDFDLLIGCTAKAAGLIMVTDNTKHFERISGLKVENWASR